MGRLNSTGLHSAPASSAGPSGKTTRIRASALPPSAYGHRRYRRNRRLPAVIQFVTLGTPGRIESRDRFELLPLFECFPVLLGPTHFVLEHAPHQTGDRSFLFSRLLSGPAKHLFPHGEGNPPQHEFSVARVGERCSPGTGRRPVPTSTVCARWRCGHRGSSRWGPGTGGTPGRRCAGSAPNPRGRDAAGGIEPVPRTHGRRENRPSG